MATSQTLRLLDDSWIVASADQIEAMPETLAGVMDAYSVGCMDAEAGEPCEPLVHYARLGDIESYISGWNDATFAMEEAADAEEYRRDVEFWRQGCY